MPYWWQSEGAPGRCWREIARAEGGEGDKGDPVEILGVGCKGERVADTLLLDINSFAVNATYLRHAPTDSDSDSNSDDTPTQPTQTPPPNHGS